MQQTISETEKRNYQLIFLALARESLYRCTWITLYSTQILAAMSTVFTDKNTLSTIKSGEGKTFILSMIASLLWFSGHTVDICTYNMELALRDEADLRDFYTFM